MAIFKSWRGGSQKGREGTPLRLGPFGLIFRESDHEGELRGGRKWVFFGYKRNRKEQGRAGASIFRGGEEHQGGGCRKKRGVAALVPKKDGGLSASAFTEICRGDSVRQGIWGSWLKSQTTGEKILKNQKETFAGGTSGEEERSTSEKGGILLLLASREKIATYHVLSPTPKEAPRRRGRYALKR